MRKFVLFLTVAALLFFPSGAMSRNSVITLLDGVTVSTGTPVVSNVEIVDEMHGYIIIVLANEVATASLIMKVELLDDIGNSITIAESSALTSNLQAVYKFGQVSGGTANGVDAAVNHFFGRNLQITCTVTGVGASFDVDLSVLTSG